MKTTKLVEFSVKQNEQNGKNNAKTQKKNEYRMAYYFEPKFKYPSARKKY